MTNKPAIDQHQVKLQALQQQLASQDILISSLQIQNNALNEQINALHASVSWKITAPVRAIVNVIISLRQNLIIKIHSHLVNQLRKLLLKIYQINWIKKRSMGILERFPTLEKRLIGLMHKQNTYMSNPYYHNDNITNTAYLPKTARHIYSELLINIQIEK